MEKGSEWVMFCTTMLLLVTVAMPDPANGTQLKKMSYNVKLPCGTPKAPDC